MEYLKSFKVLNVSPVRYMTIHALPILGAGVVVAILLPRLLQGWLPGWLLAVAPLVVVLLATATAVLFPVVQADNRRNEINHAVPFFMTHFGVLASSNLPRPEIFRILASRKEYKALAGELGKIHDLVAKWNMALPQACRFVGASTPSQILADFLDRLAQAFETGQDLEVFLRNEQHVVMREYATVYETSLYQVESLKEMYTSLIMSGVFFAVFGLITPVIMEVNPTSVFTNVLVFFVFVELLLLFLIKIRVPSDRLWHDLPISTSEPRWIQGLLLGGIMTCSLLFAVLTRLPQLPIYLSVAMSLTPLAVAGIYSQMAERRIHRREDNYGAFIRSVGAAAEARGSSLREVLKKVRTHNFGPLTQMVHNLFARLTWHLHDVLAWRHFAAESGSKLVANFNEMFVEGVRAGGKPSVIGSIISENVVRILNLRKSRYSAAGTFRGLIYGLTASMTFTLFIGLGVFEVLGNLFASTGPTPFSPLNPHFEADIGTLRLILLGVILIHSLVGSVLLKLVDGGRQSAGLLTFVILVWMGIGIAYLSERVMSTVFRSVGTG